jgi:cephalosporin hydroxylase
VSVRPLVCPEERFESYLDYFHHYCVDENVSWMGKNAQKFPLDAWIYQEIIHDIKPDIVIEIGNNKGGSTLYLANILDLIGNGTVLGIDINHSKIDFTDKRIRWITGDANSNKTMAIVKSHVKSSDRVLVIEDSSHTYENTLAVLRNYSSLVSVGSYIIVEDGICMYPFIDGPKPGPYEAVQEFLKENRDFAPDFSREKFRLTYNPSGYLMRTK